jgi:hypothetical protein
VTIPSRILSTLNISDILYFALTVLLPTQHTKVRKQTPETGALCAVEYQQSLLSLMLKKTKYQAAIKRKNIILVNCE